MAGLIENNMAGSTPAIPGKELEFLGKIKATPWHEEFIKDWGEAPDLNTKKYDYRKAMENGVMPVRDKYDNKPNPKTGNPAPEGGRYHWGSAIPGTGEMLKSDDHKTAWMEYFMRKTGGVEPEAVVRQPSQSEEQFFKENPKVGGMADFESGKIVLNPFSTLSAQEKAAVAQNEYTRLMIRKLNISPEFELTPEQAEAFKGYGNEKEIKETVVARIISGDPSALNATRDQIVAAEQIQEQISSIVQE